MMHIRLLLPICEDLSLLWAVLKDLSQSPRAHLGAVTISLIQCFSLMAANCSLTLLTFKINHYLHGD